MDDQGILSICDSDIVAISPFHTIPVKLSSPMIITLVVGILIILVVGIITIVSPVGTIMS
jgi:hypothetical protein